MAREFAEDFYNSRAWKECRRSYAKKARGLCERCLASGIYTPGEIVHHKIYLTPDNIGRPEVTLGYDNLMLVCRKCHGEIHGGHEKRFVIGADGKVTAV